MRKLKEKCSTGLSERFRMNCFLKFESLLCVENFLIRVVGENEKSNSILGLSLSALDVLICSLYM